MYGSWDLEQIGDRERIFRAARVFRPVYTPSGWDLPADVRTPALDKYYGKELLEMDDCMPLSIVSAQLENDSGADTPVFTCMQVARRKFIKGDYKALDDHQFLNVGRIMSAPGNVCDIRITIRLDKKNYKYTTQPSKTRCYCL